jgi:hypothetical protein
MARAKAKVEKEPSDKPILSASLDNFPLEYRLTDMASLVHIVETMEPNDYIVCGKGIRPNVVRAKIEKKFPDLNIRVLTNSDTFAGDFAPEEIVQEQLQLQPQLMFVEAASTPEAAALDVTLTKKKKGKRNKNELTRS